MKYIKLIFKVIFVALIPIIFQLFGFSITGIYIGITEAAKTLGEDIDPNALADSMANDIARITPHVILISSICVIFAFYLIHKGKKRNNISVAYRFNKIQTKHIPYVIALGFVGCLFSIGFSSLINLASLDPEMIETLSTLVVNNSIIITLLSVGIFVPLCEEIVFRGSILKNLSGKLSVKWAIIIQAILFSAYHMNMVQAFPTLVLGLLTGFAVYYTNSIWSGIIIHILNNLIAIILSNVLSANFEMSNLSYGVIMVISGFSIIFIIRKLSRAKSNWTIVEEPIQETLVTEDIL
ncbi:MAG: CPBP family intramembrane metalloprotease [Clostridiales bacterium]|nr:CPBP family intramembrane metalloprotease [Clostridiales bacterium]